MHLTATTRKIPRQFFATPLLIIYIFIALIIVGTLLLLLPFTHHGEGMTPFVVALFTTTSAITVTGLVVENTASYWTRTGQVFILGMMYVGGLGFMTLATFLLIIIGRRVTLAQRLMVREMLFVNQLGGLVRLAIGIIVVATAIQFLGAVALFIRFYSLYTPAEAVWQAVFHSVSAFNGAGFVVLNEPNGIIDFQGDRAMLIILTLLIFVGAISYLAIIDILRFRKFRLYSLNTKLVLVFTAILTLIAMTAFLAQEYRNPQTLGPLSVGDKVVGSVFQAVSSRTAGFTIVDLGVTNQDTNFLTTGLMFIGGASASVSGGIKVNTLAVIVVAVLAGFKGRSHASGFGREIPWAQVQRAMVIGGIGFGFLFFVTVLVGTIEDGFQFLDLLFEVTSAFGTVGLSTGLTSDLSTWSKLILVVTMFLGKLGPLTLGLTMAQQPERHLYRYPQEGVVIG